MSNLATYLCLKLACEGNSYENSSYERKISPKSCAGVQNASDLTTRSCLRHEGREQALCDILVSCGNDLMLDIHLPVFPKGSSDDDVARLSNVISEP